MKLILGTAQFGNGYGIKNKFNKIDLKKIIEILEISKKKGINYLDTASDYNFINRIKGKYNLSKFEIINKISYKDTLHYSNLKKNIFNDLNNLKKNNFYCIHLHQPHLYKKRELDKLYNFLLKLKSEKVVKKLGFSIYKPEEFFYYQKYFKPNIVQAPLNIFDRRIIKFGLDNYLEKKGIQLHARSIFLQGLLLMKNKDKYFKKWDKNFKLLDFHAKKNSLTNYELSINFIKQQKKINSIIFGVDNINQLKNSLKAFKKPNVNIPKNLGLDNELILNPSNWQI
tara:strand:+ start:6736 stop:7584 length:849 start_codon:yes stop_codon:yes gene_type:complete